MEKLLEVKDLKVSFFTDLGETQAVKGAGFAIGEGDFFGIVGESGSGKSVTTKSILRLGPSNCKIMGGEILFRGEDILKKNEAELREIRGGEIAMIFQDSLSALNPVYTVGNKMVELIAPYQYEQKRSKGPGAGASHSRWHHRPGKGYEQLSPRAFRRYAPACDDRHGHEQ